MSDPGAIAPGPSGLRGRQQRRYQGPACPKCNGALDLGQLGSGESRCPHCGLLFLASPFSAPVVRDRVTSLAEAGPQGAAPCARHAGNAAVGNCSRCGVFLCALCRISIDRQELCPGCFDRLNAEESLSTARTRIRDYRGLAVAVGLFGLLVSCFGLITGPLTLYLVTRAFRQRKLLQEQGGRTALVLAGLLGVIQILIGIFMILAMFVPAALNEAGS